MRSRPRATTGMACGVVPEETAAPPASSLEDAAPEVTERVDYGGETSRQVLGR
jgi:hypothetical protein